MFFVASALAALMCVAVAAAQAPARGATQPRGRTAATQPATGRVYANLAQLMRGILFPNSNVIFAAQNEEFAARKPAGDPSLSTDPITSTYGGWQAVENSSLALAESASLLEIPGRRCGNGRPVPIGNADWQKFVQELRDAAMTAYKAAQSKNQDRILDAADRVSTACSLCHEVYREKTPEQGGEKNRCVRS